MKWYYEKGNGQEGPVDLSVLQAMVASGDIQPTHKVWSKELPDWTPAGDVEELRAPVADEPEAPSELEAAMAALGAATGEPDSSGQRQSTEAGEGSPSAQRFDVTLQSAGKNKIAIIKAIRDITGLGLREAKDVCEDAPSRFIEGVTAAEAAKIKARIAQEGGAVEISQSDAAVSGGARGSAESSKPQFDLILGSDHDDPDETHGIANAIRDVLDIELQDAMDLVAGAPCVLIEGLGRADAYAIEQHVLEAGGDIKWVERSVPIEGGPRRPSDRFFAAFDEDLYRDLVEQAKDEEGDADDDDDDDEDIGCLGWLGIIWVCGMVFAGCIRLCGG